MADTAFECETLAAYLTLNPNAGAQVFSDFDKLMCMLSESNKDRRDFQSFIGFATRPDGPFIGIIRDGPKIIATGTLTVGELYSGIHAWLDNMVVHEDYRGRKLGKKLAAYLIGEAKRVRVRQIELTSRPHRIEAHGLYEGLGFIRKETGVFVLPL